MHVCHFRITLQLQNGTAAVNDKLKDSLPSKLISLSECQLQQVNEHIQKPWETVTILQAELARNDTISTTTLSIQLKKGEERAEIG